MSLRHVGGKSDGGIDLQGWWWVPKSDSGLASTSSRSLSSSSSRVKAATADTSRAITRKRIRVFAQCKAEKKKLGPHYVRELEGVLHRHQLFPRLAPELSASDSIPTAMVGLLISESAFTKYALLHASSSAVPLMLLHIPPQPDSSGLLNSDLDQAEHSAHTHDVGHNASLGEVGSILLNQALSSRSGPLSGEIEARWEWSSSGQGRPGLWWGGKRILSWVPDLRPSAGQGQDGMENDFRTILGVV